jgi:polyhydroxyalkanoate synthesis regulator phasin
MNELWAALIGVAATTVVMAIGNNSSRKERDIRELFHRVNALEKQVAEMKPRSWRG